jgi:hypothetical protein
MHVLFEITELLLLYKKIKKIHVKTFWKKCGFKKSNKILIEAILTDYKSKMLAVLAGKVSKIDSIAISRRIAIFL